MAVDHPADPPWWALNTTRENVYMSLLMTLMFVLQMEREAAGLDAPSTHYPSPMARITLVVSEFNRVWREEANETDDLQASVVVPVFELIGDFERSPLQIALMRDFTDPTIRDAVLREIDRTLAALERELPAFERHLFVRLE